MTRLILVFIVFVFLARARAQGSFNVLSPNLEQLNTLVMEKINSKRENAGATVLEVFEPLQRTAVNFTTNRIARVIKLSSDRHLYMKKAKEISWKYGYTNTLIDVVITVQQAVNYKGGSFYRDKENNESGSLLYYGHKPSKKEKEEGDFVVKPVEDFSYDELAARIADAFLRDRRSLKALNSGYTLAGCSCSLEPKTLNRTRIPMVKAVFVLGGRRINF